MNNLHEEVQQVKELGVLSIMSDDPVDKARYEHAFWSLMHDNGPQILDIVDDALQERKEEEHNDH